ncbi:MAG: hypothetical protein ACOXZW_02630 [Bacilli bacterium]|jgi:hypothetical protein|nr:hypothetical protein [Bacilli bacterium]
MKKVTPFIFMVFIIILGCFNQKTVSFKRYTEEIKAVQFDEVSLITDDFMKINNILDKIAFTNKKMTDLDLSYKELIITTVEDDNYYFYIYPNNTIVYKHGDEKYFASHDTTVLNEFYTEVEEKYTDMSFYNITFNTDFNHQNDDIVIHLTNGKDNYEDKSINAYHFISNEEVYNFKVSLIEYANDKPKEKAIIYFKNILPKNEALILDCSSDEEAPFIKITFTTKYNYQLTIITYKNKNNKIDFNQSIEPKQ